MLLILAPILVFGLVIFVHELGHFIAAKALGVYAPRFSVGFGPALFRKRYGETEYVLSILPLGGFVRMASRHDAEAAFIEGGSEEQSAKKEDEPGYDPNAMIPFGPKPVPENRWFESKPLWARIVIMIAGIVMNTLLAIVVAVALGVVQGRDTVNTTIIGAVRPTAAVPAMGQLKVGSSIMAVNGQPVANWMEVQARIVESAREVVLTTDQNEVRVPLKIGEATAEDVLRSMIFDLPPVIDVVVKNDPADKAGVQRGDSIVAVDGAPIRSWSDVVARVEPSAGRAMNFVVARGTGLDTLTITPRSAEVTDSVAHRVTVVGKIGAAGKSPVKHQNLSLGEAIPYGLHATWENAGRVFQVLHSIGNGTRSVRELGGPIAITRAAVERAKSSLADVFDLLALISINVAVFNLLPIPILDGGQILINVLESAKGSPFSMRSREYILRFGLAVIALLFVTVMYNDTRAGFVKLFGWVGKLFGA